MFQEFAYAVSPICTGNKSCLAQTYPGAGTHSKAKLIIKFVMSAYLIRRQQQRRLQQYALPHPACRDAPGTPLAALGFADWAEDSRRPWDGLGCLVLGTTDCTMPALEGHCGVQGPWQLTGHGLRSRITCRELTPSHATHNLSSVTNRHTTR